jgi:NRAMP (natural resistance-associated macrophage protein)-like metal ion transporter
VTAAFIGPGTITTASNAGANFGFALTWALAYSVFATIVLQEMAARLGLVARIGPAEAMRRTLSPAPLRYAGLLLVVAAIGLGNAAYQAGNITGAALALQSVWGGGIGAWSLLIGAVSLALLASGRYRLLETVLIALVLLMSVVFALTAAVVAPALSDILAGLLRPSLPAGSGLTVIALIGTTVVPYNLFLHAHAVRQKWPASQALDRSLRESRIDTGLSVGLGGLITLAIMSTAAAAFFGSASAFEAGSMADQLEPLLGPWARYVFALGLFAGGLTSAITAPLAAAYAVCGAAGWRQELSAPAFRGVWSAVLLVGTLLAATGSRPLAAILFAQATNGFLLPFIALFLLLVMNRADLLGEHRNGPLANLLGLLVVVTALGLGGVKLASVAGLL